MANGDLCNDFRTECSILHSTEQKNKSHILFAYHVKRIWRLHLSPEPGDLFELSHHPHTNINVCALSCPTQRIPSAPLWRVLWRWGLAEGCRWHWAGADAIPPLPVPAPQPSVIGPKHLQTQGALVAHCYCEALGVSIGGSLGCRLRQAQCWVLYTSNKQIHLREECKFMDCSDKNDASFVIHYHNIHLCNIRAKIICLPYLCTEILTLLTSV